MSSPAPGLQCTFCGDSFRRREHLDRHLRRHSGAKPFQCKFCARSFSRKDSLIRHSSTHKGDGSGHSPASSTTPFQRKSQACSPCAKSKRRCSGGIPCEPCKRKGLDCHFSDERPQVAVSGVERSQSVGDDQLFEEQAANKIAVLDSNNPGSGPLRDSTPTDEAPLSGASLGGDNGQPSAHLTSVDASTALTSPRVDQVSSTFPSLELLQVLPHSTTDTNIAFEGGMTALSDGMLPSSHSWSTGFFPLSSNPFPWEVEENRVDPFNLENLDVSSISVPTDDVHEYGVPDIPQLQPSKPLAPDNKDKTAINNPRLDLPISNAYFQVRETEATEACLLFPKPHPSDDDVIWAEDFYYGSRVGPEAYESIRQFLEDEQRSEDANLPSRKIFHVFVQLYYEHFDSHFPMVHPSTLNEGSDSWILLLAMTAIGCQYSQIRNQEQYATCLRELLLRAVAKKLRKLRSPSIQFIQSLLLTQICLNFSGSMKLVTKMQIDTDLLVYLCNRLGGDKTAGQYAESTTEIRWKAWIAAEARSRLLHCIFRLECLQVVLMDFPPVFHYHDLINKLPSEERLWQCRNRQQWETEMRSSQSSYNAQLAGESEKKPAGSFARDMYALILHVDETLISAKSSTSSLRKSVIGPYSTIGSPHVAESDASDPLEHMPLLSTIKSSVEGMFEVLLFDDQEVPTKTLFHLISILRQVQLRHLFAFSRWRATEAEAEESKSHLQSWLQNDPVTARRCLWHAVMVLSTTRSKQQLACHEPFALIISVLMIWVFDVLAKPCDTGDWESLETSRDQEGRPTRIDRLKTLRDVERWAKEGRNDRVLVTGIGILRGPESSRLLLMECRKILLSGTEWAALRLAIDYGVSEALQGRSPSHPEHT